MNNSTFRTDQLTKREIEILKMIANEFSTKEIAFQLFLAYDTIKNYRKNILLKLDVKNMNGAIRVAFEEQLLRV